MIDLKCKICRLVKNNWIHDSSYFSANCFYLKEFFYEFITDNLKYLEECYEKQNLV